MTPIFATQPALAITDLHHIQVAATQMEAVAIADDAPWLYSAFFQLRNLEDSGQNYPGVGDLRIDPGTSQIVKHLLSNLAVGNLPAPSLDVFSGGGVTLRWQMCTREVTFSVFPNREIVFEQYRDDVMFEDGILSNVSDGTQRLMWLTQP